MTDGTQYTLDVLGQESRFGLLARSVAFCDLCPRMCGRTKVLSAANGNIRSRVMFVAEAPGRLGAERTGIPLHGDKAGSNFESLLSIIGWEREMVFVTNAVLCNPQTNGNNGTPTDEEIANCSNFLRMTIDVVRPDVVVSLGATGLKSLSFIQPHSYSLRANVGMLVKWAGRHIFVAYHPGQRAAVHRSIDNQRADFYKLSKLVHPTTGLFERPPRRHQKVDTILEKPSPLLQAITYFVQSAKSISQFKLSKLLYLADLKAISLKGEGITGAVYIRQVQGPWFPQIASAFKSLVGYEIEVSYRNGVAIVHAGPDPRITPSLPDEDMEVIVEVGHKYGAMSNAEIKTVAYLTTPMRAILKEEKMGTRMLNRVVLDCRAKNRCKS